MSLKNILSICVCLFFVGCNESPPDPKDIAGNYIGKYGAIKERIELHQDGTFNQAVFWHGEPIQNKGTWKINQMALEFFHIYVAYSATGDLLDPPQLAYNKKAVWVNYQGHRRIAFDIDRDYVLDREEVK